MVGYEFFSFMENRVPSIAAAVISQNVSVFLRLAQKVGNFAFAAIPILEIDDDIHFYL